MPALAQCLFPYCMASFMYASRAATWLQPIDIPCLLQDLPYDLYVAHANYVAGGYKRHRFRETGLWSYDHQDYYNKGYYLSFDMKYPEEPPDWEQWDARQRVGMHLQALQLQQDQVRGQPIALPQIQSIDFGKTNSGPGEGSSPSFLKDPIC